MVHLHHIKIKGFQLLTNINVSILTFKTYNRDTYILEGLCLQPPNALRYLYLSIKIYLSFYLSKVTQSKEKNKQITKSLARSYQIDKIIQTNKSDSKKLKRKYWYVNMLTIKKFHSLSFTAIQSSHNATLKCLRNL